EGVVAAAGGELQADGDAVAGAADGDGGGGAGDQVERAGEGPADERVDALAVDGVGADGVAAGGVGDAGDGGDGADDQVVAVEEVLEGVEDAGAVEVFEAEVDGAEGFADAYGVQVGLVDGTGVGAEQVEAVVAGDGGGFGVGDGQVAAPHGGEVGVRQR